MITIPTKSDEQKGSVIDVGSAALSTLAVDTGQVLSGPVMTRGGAMISAQIAATVTVLTAGDGPFLFGIANKSLTLAELEEYLELDGPVEPTQVPQVERATRGKLIRTLGLIVPTGDGTVASLLVDNRSLSGLRWNEESAGWNYWVYNRGRALTTGSILRVWASFFMRWNKSG